MRPYDEGKQHRILKPEQITFDLPCARCGTNLRGLARNGQCRECDMENAKSLSVAACRIEDPAALARIKLGIDAQTSGTLLALLACIIGPLLYRGSVSFEAFAVVVAVILGVVSFAAFSRDRHQGWRLPDISKFAGAAVGSVAIVIPAVVLRMSASGDHIQIAALVALLIGAIFWFIGESSKMHLLEEWSLVVAGKDMRQRARNLRWGTYIALGVIAAGLIPAAFMGVANASYLTIQFVTTVCVALLLFTLLGTLLQGRMSVALQQHVSLALAVSNANASTTLRQQADVPNWVVWPHPPRWSSF